MTSRVTFALLLATATALGLAAECARADTPAPANPPAPITLTTPPPPVVTAPADSAARATAQPVRTPVPAAPSAASTLGLKTAALPEEAAPAAASGGDPRSPEPKVEHLVTEDSAVRIEEERVRSQTTRIVVKSKVPGMGSYEIVPQDLSRDPATDSKAGKRVWLNIGF